MSSFCDIQINDLLRFHSKFLLFHTVINPLCFSDVLIKEYLSLHTYVSPNMINFDGVDFS